MPASNYIIDAFIGFPGGVNSGVAPSLLPHDQLSFAVNSTVRGGYITNRPTLRKIELDFGNDSVLQGHFELGRFQGSDFYLSDDGEGSFTTAIGGHLFKVKPDASLPTATVQEVTISFAVATTILFLVPAIGSVVSIVVVDTANMAAGAGILINGANYTIISVNGPNSLTVQNIDDTASNHPPGAIVQYFDLNPASRPISWMQQAEKWMIIQDGQSVPIIYDGASSRRSNPVGANPEISAGKMMAYWLGRLWWVNPDGRTFRAGDLVYSSSGTSSQKLRDSVLHQTQNTFIADGGNFTVPANAGQITAMIPVAVLDNSLGQGPLQVSTATMMFGCTASTDSTQWQTTNSPILGVSLFENGSLSQWSSILVNGDMFYRAIDGIRTLVLGRREFNVWGNVPVSREMNLILETDQENLLGFSSAIVFDNRMLMTSGPVASQRGTYHRGVIALDFDVISSMRGKLPSVYDGLWTGLRTLKLVKGRFGNTERAFAFTLTTAGTIEFWEIQPSGAATQDNGDTPITWSLETGDIFKESGIKAGQKVRLYDGEMFIDQIVGFVSFNVYFRPDQSSCWVPWRNFAVCNKTCQQAVSPDECLTEPFPSPGFRNRFGFGETPDHCNSETNSPYREGWTFQLKIVVTGSCRIKSLRFKGIIVDEPECAPAVCQDGCYEPVTYPSYEQSTTCSDPESTLVNVSAIMPDGISIVGKNLVIAAGTYYSSISAADATQQAYRALKSFFKESLESGALACVPFEWFCNSSGYYSDGSDLIQMLPDCSNAPEGMLASGFEVSINPEIPFYDFDCNGDAVHQYQYDQIGFSSSVYGPFDVEKTFTVDITYHAVGYLYENDPFCFDQTSLDMQVAAQSGGDIQTWSMNFTGAPFDTAGTAQVVIVVPIGQTVIFTASVSGFANAPIVGGNAPVTDLSFVITPS